MRYKHFQQLFQARHRFGSGRSEDRDSSGTSEQSGQDTEEETEEDVFLRAMQDVQPLKDKKGREVVPHSPQKSKPRRESHEEQGRRYLEDLVNGRVEFEIQDTNEFLQGSVKGLDSRLIRKLKAGQYSPEAHLDLHGLTVEEAHVNLILFVKKSYLSGKRCLLVIPGRGKNSPEGKGVLREQLHAWLTRNPLKRVVLAFTTAQPQHGGAGALYILLRKYKKSRGKIVWDRNPLDDDL
jgi:DNA-nicking Smr family endonuclease